MALEENGERKTNKAVLDLEKEKGTLLNCVRTRRWYTMGYHTLRQNMRKLYSVIPEGIIEEKCE